MTPTMRDHINHARSSRLSFPLPSGSSLGVEAPESPPVSASRFSPSPALFVDAVAAPADESALPVSMGGALFDGVVSTSYRMALYMANSPRKNQLDPFHDDDYGDYATESDHDTGDDD